MMKPQEQTWWANAKARRALALHRQGWSYKEIAASLKTTPTYASHLAHRGARLETSYELRALDKREHDEWERTLRLKPEFIEVP